MFVYCSTVHVPLRKYKYIVIVTVTGSKSNNLSLSLEQNRKELQGFTNTSLLGLRSFSHVGMYLDNVDQLMGSLSLLFGIWDRQLNGKIRYTHL